jgi:hypothetical protein
MEYYFQKMIGSKYPSSGWKLHIYGESKEDSIKIYNSIENILIKYELGSKIALDTFFKDFPKEKKQWGKACTIYIPISFFDNDNNLNNCISELNENLIKNKYKKKGEIFGDKKLINSIHYRYQLKIPLKKGGFSREESRYHYQRNNGNHNLENNFDPFVELDFRGI